MNKVPEYFEYLNWYDLYTPLGVYGFIQEMIQDEIDLNNYPDIKIYYDILFENAFRDDPNIISVDYIVKKLRQCFIRYGFAHTSKKIEGKRFYYYWFDKEV